MPADIAVCYFTVAIRALPRSTSAACPFPIAFSLSGGRHSSRAAIKRSMCQDHQMMLLPFSCHCWGSHTCLQLSVPSQIACALTRPDFTYSSSHVLLLLYYCAHYLVDEIHRAHVADPNVRPASFFIRSNDRQRPLNIYRRALFISLFFSNHIHFRLTRELYLSSHYKQ